MVPNKLMDIVRADLLELKVRVVTWRLIRRGIKLTFIEQIIIQVTTNLQRYDGCNIEMV